MLQSLHIENVAVIEKTDISFGSGLTVLTGETGAGKSIVIDAINALLGERITRDVVRHGADRAYIAGVFDDLPGEVLSFLQEQELSPEEDGTLLIQRSLTADGKGSCRVGGRPATVSVLRQLGRMLVNIHGQHENQALLSAERHVEYLDRLGELEGVKAEYVAAYREYCRIRRAIKAATMDEQEKEFRTAQLTQWITVLEQANIKAGEEQELLCSFPIPDPLSDIDYSREQLRILDENDVAYGKDIIKIITPLGYLGTAKYYIEQLGLDMPVEEIVAGSLEK